MEGRKLTPDHSSVLAGHRLDEGMQPGETVAAGLPGTLAAGVAFITKWMRGLL
jgi:hypothetical protein